MVLRAAILSYAALLILGAWPYRDAPLIGAPADWARRVLGTVSIRSGMEIFNAGEPRPVEWKLQAFCHRLVGVGRDGEEEVLYGQRCPRSGVRFGIDYLETLVQRVTRASSERQLLKRTEAREPDHRTRAVQRYIALGDWACRRNPDYRSVRLVQQRRFQSYRTGAHRAGPVLECTWYCDERPAPRPRCSRRPSDAPVALVDGAQ